jgi:hypothetical protein
MTLDAIKQAIQQLPEPEQREFMEWFEAEFVLGDAPQHIHEKIGLGLAQLDRGEGVSGELSRKQLHEKQVAWLKQETRS